MVESSIVAGQQRESRNGTGAGGVPRPRDAPAGGPEPVRRPRFEVALRGYDRTAVDAYVEQTVAERQSLLQELAAGERRRQQAEQHAASTERENSTLRQGRAAKAPEAPSDEGFGFRVERLLRLAEQEAAEARGGAAREASALLEQARAQAEHHRHEVEQDLIARSTALDQQAAQRSIDLQEREQQVADAVAAARAEADALHAAATRAADQRRAQAEAEADDVRERAEFEARRVLAQARQEADRLAAVQGGTRADLARLVDLLATELGGPSTGKASPGAEPSGGKSDDAQAGPDADADDRSPVTASTGR